MGLTSLTVDMNPLLHVNNEECGSLSLATTPCQSHSISRNSTVAKSCPLVRHRQPTTKRRIQKVGRKASDTSRQPVVREVPNISDDSALSESNDEDEVVQLQKASGRNSKFEEAATQPTKPVSYMSMPRRKNKCRTRLLH